MSRLPGTSLSAQAPWPAGAGNFLAVLLAKSMKISSTPLVSLVLERTNHSLPAGSLTTREARTLNPRQGWPSGSKAAVDVGGAADARDVRSSAIRGILMALQSVGRRIPSRA